MKSEVRLICDLKDEMHDIETVWEACSWGWNSNQDRMISIFSNRWKNFVLYVESRPVAYAGLVSDHNVYALVVDMMVNPDYQKKGLGKRLVRHIVETCKSEDIKVLKLISSEQGKKLYSSTGFEVCSENAPGMMMKLYELNNE